MGLEEKRQEREIDGTIYVVNALPFNEGNAALVRIIHIAAPLVGAALKDGSTPSADGIADALALLPQHLKEKDLDYFLKLFANYSSFLAENGNQVPLSKTYEVHFAGKYSTYFKWMAACFEVNFGGFFSDLISGKLIKGTNLLSSQTT